MSWLNDIKTDLLIITGDGKQFKPNWINATKQKDYNVTEFNFPEVKGTLVDRREAKGGRYNLELYFQGENHLVESRAFETSADDKRYWTFTHPFYGKLFVQPLSLLFDNKKYNTTKVTGVIVETLTDNNPKTDIIPVDKIDEDVEVNNEAVAASFENDVVMESQDINTTSALIKNDFDENSKNIEVDDDNQGYFNKLNTAENALRNVTTTAGQKMREIQNFIEAPARFKQSLDSRLNMLEGNYNSLRLTINGALGNISNNKRRSYEASSVSTLSAIALAASLPFDENDYDTRFKVNDVIARLLNLQRVFIDDLDYLQSGSGGDIVDYIPNAASISGLNNIYNFTLSNLFSIASGAKQERFLELEFDSDIISIAHRLYGLKQDDSTIDELIRNNDIGLNEILIILKGRLIKYYI